MFAEAIEKHVDIEDRRRDLRNAFVDLAACELLLPTFESRRKKMKNAVIGTDLWQEINDTSIPEDLFINAAVRGDYWISPQETKNVFASLRPAVENSMNEAVRND